MSVFLDLQDAERDIEARDFVGISFDVESDSANCAVLPFLRRYNINQIEVIEYVIDCDDNFLWLVFVGPFGNDSSLGVSMDGHVDLHLVDKPQKHNIFSLKIVSQSLHNRVHFFSV